MKKILGYLANNGTVNERDAKNLTHLNVAFGQLCMDGSIDVSRLNIFEQLDKLRAWNPQLKIVVSLVPKEPDAFTVCAASESLRRKVAEASVSMVEDYHLDGVDFDWELSLIHI